LRRDPDLRSRLMIGAVAGIAGAAIVGTIVSRLPRRAIQAKSPHPNEAGESKLAEGIDGGSIACGAACGSLLAAANPRAGPFAGALAGAGVWAATHLGWVPRAGIVKTAAFGAKRRNAVAMSGHLFWGVATALVLRELAKASQASPTEE
jgi:hypothetical protein